MSRFAQALMRRLPDRPLYLRNFQPRFARSRPGSVLILVVALLVLLALMGTAFISTSGKDRYSAQQNSFNTEIDLLIDAVVKIEQLTLLNAKGAPTDMPAGSMLWTSAADSTYFGDRVPVTLPALNVPGWAHICANPLPGGKFESPSNLLTYSTTTNLVPDYIQVTNSSGKVTYPAFVDPATGVKYLAASASGDGIADAGLWRLPLGELNGITYYAAVRVLDNGSALNMSIAEQRNPSRTLPGDFFPTNIDLGGTLGASTAQRSQFDLYRWNAPLPSLTPIYDDGTTLSYRFASFYEAMWSQLGRRLDNPGFNTAGVHYQALPVGESIAMAHRFCLQNAAASPSIVEQAFASILMSPSVSSQPYSASQVTTWFNNNFQYGTAGKENFRPLLVARNQVSNISGSRFTPRNAAGDATKPPGAWDVTQTYSFGDWVIGADGRSYVCIQDSPTVAPTPYTDPNTQTSWRRSRG